MNPDPTTEKSTEADTRTTQIYRVYIKTTPQAIWDALTSPQWTDRYGFGGFVEFDLTPGGRYQVRPSEQMRVASEQRGNILPEVTIEGEVVEADPPTRLVHTFHMLMDPRLSAESVTRVSYDIVDLGDGTCRLTLTHELAGAPQLAAFVSGALEEYGAGGGHAWVLSDLKTLLETGARMGG